MLKYSPESVELSVTPIRSAADVHSGFKLLRPWNLAQAQTRRRAGGGGPVTITVTPGNQSEFNAASASEKLSDVGNSES
jgi:hypothetical protein